MQPGLKPLKVGSGMEGEWIVPWRRGPVRQTLLP